MINKFIRIDFPENFLMPWLGKTSKMLRMFLKINFQEHGFDLTHEQFILIAHFYLRDGINQKDLAFITERNKGSLERLVNTKEKNNEVFIKCTETLLRNRSLLIFGEGVTDDKFIRRLKSIKKGALRIGFTTLEACNWKEKVYVAAIGCNYSNPSRFGSDLLIKKYLKI
mgnify:CR=1 FL=1